MLNNNWISRLLQSHHIGTRGLDHFGDRLGATDAALANVVGE